jgi:hypothetical protein
MGKRTCFVICLVKQKQSAFVTRPLENLVLFYQSCVLSEPTVRSEGIPINSAWLYLHPEKEKH